MCHLTFQLEKCMFLNGTIRVKLPVPKRIFTYFEIAVGTLYLLESDLFIFYSIAHKKKNKKKKNNIPADWSRSGNFASLSPS